MSDPPIKPEIDKPKIIVDDDWKSQVQAEKEALKSEDREAPSPSVEQEKPPADDLPPLPPASFSALAMMLATQASMLLQEAADPDPDAKNRAAHLEHAKHFIDMLAVLQEKTAGNLTTDEAMTLENILHELRMAHVSLRGR